MLEKDEDQSADAKEPTDASDKPIQPSAQSDPTHITAGKEPSEVRVIKDEIIKIKGIEKKDEK